MVFENGFHALKEGPSQTEFATAVIFRPGRPDDDPAYDQKWNGRHKRRNGTKVEPIGSQVGNQTGEDGQDSVPEC